VAAVALRRRGDGTAKCFHDGIFVSIAALKGFACYVGAGLQCGVGGDHVVKGLPVQRGAVRQFHAAEERRLILTKTRGTKFGD
jgi:hypothetical protein